MFECGLKARTLLHVQMLSDPRTSTLENNKKGVPRCMDSALLSIGTVRHTTSYKITFMSSNHIHMTYRGRRRRCRLFFLEACRTSHLNPHLFPCYPS